MNNEPLAPIFLDNKPIVLKDPKPKVSTVLSAGGQAQATEVKWLQSQTSTQGTFLRPEQTLDRTSEPTKAIYLTSLVRGPSSPIKQPVKVDIVDEDVTARPFTATPKTTTPWSTDAKAAPAASDDDDMAEGESDDADESDDDSSPDTKSGE